VGELSHYSCDLIFPEGRALSPPAVIGVPKPEAIVHSRAHRRNEVNDH
jgi:hypothetical protein